MHFLLFVKTTGRSGLVGVHSTAEYISPETKCNRLAEDKVHARRLIVKALDFGLRGWWVRNPDSAATSLLCLPGSVSTHPTFGYDAESKACVRDRRVARWLTLFWLAMTIATQLPENVYSTKFIFFVFFVFRLCLKGRFPSVSCFLHRNRKSMAILSTKTVIKEVPQKVLFSVQTETVIKNTSKGTV